MTCRFTGGEFVWGLFRVHLLPEKTDRAAGATAKRIQAVGGLKHPGANDLKLPWLGFGASPLGDVFGPVDEGEVLPALRAAIDGGINYFDTSPFYGLTRSEEVLGRGLREITNERGRESFLLSTKIGRYDAKVFDFSAARVGASLRESLSRLNVDFCDIVFCHDIEFTDPEQILQETLPALRAARDDGFLRFIGISGLPLALLREVADRGEVDIVLSYCHYTLFNQDLENDMSFYDERGIRLINASPLGMGLLTRDGPPDWHPASSALKQACREASALCDRAGADIAEFALAFALAAQDACTLIGMKSRAEVERNLTTLGRRDFGEHAELLDRLKGLFQSLRPADRRW